MYLFLHLCLVLCIWAPSLAYTAVLENPGNNQSYSGIGVISGWKCEATALTVGIDDGGPIPMVYGSERGDTKETKDGETICGDTNNGFLAIFNWALLSDGEHTAVAYDNGVEFARSTFEVGTLGEEFVRGASAEVRVEDFPSPGESALLAWNQNTQHFEVVPESPSDEQCRAGLVVNPGESCSFGDSDGDGIPDVSDPDDDNDGVPDTDDPCPLDGRDTCDDTTSVVSLEISGTMPLTSIGQTIQLAATTHMLDGSSQAIASAFVHWVSSDPAVATVIDGTVTAVGPGNASTVATYQGQKAVAEVSVHISARETGTVRVIYAAPSDREFRSDYRDAIQHAIVDLQSWYRRQLGGLTFSLYDATPEQCQLSETSDYYDQDPWQKVLEGVQHCAPVEDNTSTFAWVIYADLEAVCDARGSLGRGGPGLTMVGRGDLEGLIGNMLVYYDECGRGPYADPVTRWTGGIGHELGHALGLPHPPGCDDGLPTCDYDALMHLGYGTYPNTYLRPDDKQVLWRSPFIEKNLAQRQIMEEAGNVTAIRGTVIDPDGEVVEGIRVSAVSDDFWAWGETASDGTFEIRLPDDSSGSSVLSVHAGGVADCGWLGYHVAGGLTTFREHATRIELGEVDSASIEISLPAISGELCQRQRTVSGTVLGPSGDPVGVFVGAFDQWSFSGDDGLFELRLPEGSGGSSPLLVEVPECSDVGFYGPGGFTARSADAWQLEIGGVNEAGIVIRLPATPEELCH